MFDNHNYPAGADNEYAPWNQSEQEELTANGDYVFELRLKNIDVMSNEYDGDGRLEDAENALWYHPRNMIADLKGFLKKEFERDDLSNEKKAIIRQKIADIDCIELEYIDSDIQFDVECYDGYYEE